MGDLGVIRRMIMGLIKYMKKPGIMIYDLLIITNHY